MSGRVLVGVKRVIDYAVKVTFFELFNSFFVFFLDVSNSLTFLHLHC